jgi:hypothetical protein
MQARPGNLWALKIAGMYLVFGFIQMIPIPYMRQYSETFINPHRKEGSIRAKMAELPGEGPYL